MKWGRSIFFVSVFFLLLPTQASAQTIATTSPPIIYVEHATQPIIAEGSDRAWPMASITKLMTALVLFDLPIQWNGVVSLQKIDEVGGARLKVKNGARYRRIDLLHASLIGSANNATHALAQTSGVSREEFVVMMNEKAHTLGMTNTKFVDPTGMETGNMSTARDIARLITTAAGNDRMRAIAQKKRYTFTSRDAKPAKHTVQNTNIMLMDNEPMLMGKTGYLEDSRFNFAARIPHVGGPVTVVILNAPTKKESFQLTRTFVNMVP